jgi:hypothetical protein
MCDLRAHSKKEGWWVKIHGGPFQIRGVPDILGCYKGKFVAFEVKVPGKEDTQSAMQLAIFARIRLAGGVPKLVSSATDATGVLEKLDMLSAHRESEDLNEI